MQKNFISFLDWSAEELMHIVEAAESFRRRWKQETLLRPFEESASL